MQLEFETVIIAVPIEFPVRTAVAPCETTEIILGSEEVHV